MLVNGVLLLEKPIGLSSNKALQLVRGLFEGAKAGHTGTLDPLAGGLLPICFGEATKFSQFLINSDKSYSVVIRLGWMSSTGDSEGKLTRRYLGELPKLSDLRRVGQKFKGEITQIPPMHSAIKRGGKRLYKLVRKGVVVPRPKRVVKINDLVVSNLDTEFVSLKVICSKGTYIRTLVEDIGDDLGCGAYVTQLERTAVGDLCLKNAVSIQFLQSLSKSMRLNYIAKPDSMLRRYPKVVFDESASGKIKTGQKVSVQDVFADSTIIRAYGNNGDFLGLGEIAEGGQFVPKRLMANSQDN